MVSYRFRVLGKRQEFTGKYQWNMDGKIIITSSNILDYHFTKSGNHIIKVTIYINDSKVGERVKKIIVKSQFDNSKKIDDFDLNLTSMFNQNDFVYKSSQGYILSCPKGYSTVLPGILNNRVYYEYMGRQLHKHANIYFLTAKYKTYSLMSQKFLISKQITKISDINVNKAPSKYRVKNGDTLFTDKKYDNSELLPGYQIHGRWYRRVNRDNYTIHYLCIENNTNGWWKKVL